MEINSKEMNEEFNSLMNKIAPSFYGELGFTNAQNYIRGLLGTSKRKNGWQLAEYLGESKPYKLQQFIYRGAYSASEIRDKNREYIGEKIGESEGVLVADDTGFIKQGKKSCGVQRQYSGTLGKVGNCQVGVFLTYAGSKGHAPIDRRLYIPKEWIADNKRRTEAGIPEELEFQTKPEQALEMIQEATAGGLPYKWVTGDSAYGDYRGMRQWLEKNEKCYVLCVSAKESVWKESQKATVGSVLKNLASEKWFESSCGEGSKGARVYDWTVIEIESDWRPAIFGEVSDGWKRVMLVRRSKSDITDMQAYICYAPKDTPDSKLVEVAGTRWTVETCFRESKGEVGLDQYEVRSYVGWYNHISFACIALSLLTVLSCQSLDTKTLQKHNPASSSLDEFKRGRNLRV
jgi:SRSO17 transposase